MVDSCCTSIVITLFCLVCHRLYQYNKGVVNALFNATPIAVLPLTSSTFYIIQYVPMRSLLVYIFFCTNQQCSYQCLIDVNYHMHVQATLFYLHDAPFFSQHQQTLLLPPHANCYKIYTCMDKWNFVTLHLKPLLCNFYVKKAYQLCRHEIRGKTYL